jgi:hypothetical protein
VPELPLEREISETEIQKAIEKFPLNFSYVYPSSGPALYMDSLDQAMKHSIFSSDEVSINKNQIIEFKIIDAYSDVLY